MTELWRALIDGRSNFFLYGAMPSIVVTVSYLFGSLLTWLLERSKSNDRFKIQAKTQPAKAWRDCLRHVFLHKLTSEIPLTLAAYPAFVVLGVRSDLPLPGVGTVLATLVACLLIEDAWHYFAHRSLHAKWAYAKIHHIHHRYTTPFGPAANYAHPLETFYTGFGTVIPVLLIRPHLFTVLVWVVVRQWQAISVHVGYEFPWRPSRFLPFVGGARFHDRHHERFTCNYAPTFVWFDRLLGTADEKNLGIARPEPAAEE